MSDSNGNQNKQATQEIKKLSELVEIKNLTIPPYQRPYKWKAKNVLQLLDDIFENIITKDKVYRIGSLIVHEVERKDENNEEKIFLDIVDGQQRLTTISILLFHLKKGDALLLNQNYRHSFSKNNIVYNSRVIQNWLAKISDSDKENFRKQLFENCEFVLLTVYNEDEAFQLFDSQNARGKELEPYDLLKAFHLREMEFDNEIDKANAAICWEKSIDDKTLKPILANHLFKIRKWVKNERKYDFTKDDIDEFKGISLHQKQKYPYETSLRILDGFVENSQNDKFLKNNHLAQTFPFSITMPIINGKRFFEYVDHYIQLRQSLYPEKEIQIGDVEFRKFYWEYTQSYNGSGRAGDWKVRNLYENILLLYYDKFGKLDFDNLYQSFYKLVYRIRCEKGAIRLETILNSSERRVLQEINDCIQPDRLRRYSFIQYTKYDILEKNKGKGRYIFVDKYNELVN